MHVRCTHRRPALLAVNVAPTAQTAVVTFDELRTVLVSFAVGLPEASIDALTRQLLGGKGALRTAELLEMLKEMLKPEGPPPILVAQAHAEFLKARGHAAESGPSVGGACAKQRAGFLSLLSIYLSLDLQ